MTVTFELEKETKNTVKFKEVETDGYSKIGTIYIPKSTLSQENIDKNKGFTITLVAL
jgi:hypothetical protein